MTIERDALKKEKEEQLALLNDKLSTMEKSYESILQVSRLTHQIETSVNKDENRISSMHKQKHA